MMREILFRGKTVNGEWVQSGNLIRFDDDGDISYFIPKQDDKCVCIHDGSDNIVSIEEGMFYKVIPETVGQYTGQNDKNGTKIFEGDILKVKTMWHAEFPENEYGFFNPPIKKETYWSVEYKDFAGEMGFMVYGIDRRFHRPLTWNRLYNTEAEVVGNIYDNPELMKRSDAE